MRFVKYFIFVLMLGLLAGCGIPAQADSATISDASSPTNSGTLMNVDWKNFTYTVTCYGQTRQFQTKDGGAEKNGIHFQVYKTVFGDVTGDGKDEAVITYGCAAADFEGMRAIVYGEPADSPTLLGNLPLPTRDSKGDAWGSIDAIRISAGKIYVSGKGYSANAPHCCPDLQIETSYRWDGKQFVVADSRTASLKSS